MLTLKHLKEQGLTLSKTDAQELHPHINHIAQRGDIENIVFDGDDTVENNQQLKDDSDQDGIKHIITQGDIDSYPELSEHGVKIGDEVYLKALTDEEKAGLTPQITDIDGVVALLNDYFDVKLPVDQFTENMSKWVEYLKTSAACDDKVDVAEEIGDISDLGKDDSRSETIQDSSGDDQQESGEESGNDVVSATASASDIAPAPVKEKGKPGRKPAVKVDQTA